MKVSTLGRTGLEVSRVGFGAIKLPQVSEEQACRAIHRALDLGVNYIDTARNYRDSERKVGLALRGRREACILATKSTSRDAAGARRDLETSLRELDVERVQVWQLHSVSTRDAWTQSMGPGGALAAARRAQAEGLVDHVGISIHRSLYVMREAIRCGEFETVLLTVNAVDSEGIAAQGLLDEAHARGMGVIAMKALSGGTLALPLDEAAREERYRASRGTWFDPIARGGLRHVLSHPAVDVVIPGMRSVREVEENVPVADLPPLTGAEREALVREIGAQRGSYRYDQQCLRCEYCMPVCPQSIPIPHVLHAVRAYRHYAGETQQVGLDLYRVLSVPPSACTACESCVEVCPAGIPIPERMAEAVEVFAGV